MLIPEIRPPKVKYLQTTSAQFYYTYIYVYNMCMIFEWDKSKRQSNLRKHRLDFTNAAEVFAGLTFTFADERFEYGEDRYITLGLLKNTAVVIAHTERDEVIRIISMRKATKNEQILYYQSFAN